MVQVDMVGLIGKSSIFNRSHVELQYQEMEALAGNWGAVGSVTLAAGTPLCACAARRAGALGWSCGGSPPSSPLLSKKARRQRAISYRQPAVLLI